MAQIKWTLEEKLLVADLLDDLDWRKSFRITTKGVAELSALLRSTTSFHPLEGRADNFRNANGVAMKANNIIVWHPNRPEGVGAREDGEGLSIVEAFMIDRARMKTLAAQIRDKANAGVAVEIAAELGQLDPYAAEAATEGGLSAVVSYRRERDPKLRAKKLESVTNAGQPIACEVCRFDFEMTYGERGRGYIEVHHVTPLHVSGEVETRLEDLALLCANCHRMIHRTGWIQPEELKLLLVTRRQSEE